MRISRSVEEWLETDSGDLRIYIDCDEGGKPVRVNSIRFRVVEDGEDEIRTLPEANIPAEVILRIAKMLASRDQHMVGNVCIEHGCYHYKDAIGKYKTDCPKCKPSMEEMEESAAKVIS
jgi:hypothetical protein